VVDVLSVFVHILANLFSVLDSPITQLYILMMRAIMGLAMLFLCLNHTLPPIGWQLMILKRRHTEVRVIFGGETRNTGRDPCME